MIPPDIREAILPLHRQGTAVRAIGRLLGVSRNTVRRVLRGVPEPPAAQATESAEWPLIEAAFARCKGNAVRVREVLAEEQGLEVPYSALTRRLREGGLRTPKRRAGRYTFAPGEEMQQDTSPHRLTLGGKTVTAQRASLALAYSRWLYLQYYPRFTRFEAKGFLAAAFAACDGTCPRCVIDNTSVLVATGSGPEATIAPEMAAFGRAYGVRFVAHRVGDANRSARVERPFAFIEGNFLAGRTFADWDDLNRQAWPGRPRWPTSASSGPWG